MQSDVDGVEGCSVAEEEEGVVDAGRHQVSDAFLRTAGGDEYAVRVAQEEADAGAGFGLLP